MRKGFLLSLFFITACGSEAIQDSELNNQRFMGTVVSVKRTSEMNWAGAGNVVRSGAARVGNAASEGLFGGWFDSGVSGSDVSSVDGLTYVIVTEQGKRMFVNTDGRRVYYPGDEVMVVRNGDGYSDVFPRDLTHAHPGGL